MVSTRMYVCTYLATLLLVVSQMAQGQPTMPEEYWSPWWSKPCDQESLTSLEVAFNTLRNEVRNQVIESKKLRTELMTVADHNKQSRAILAKLIETLHIFVTRMAARSPCKCSG